jgi:RHS repeat-associated protein
MILSFIELVREFAMTESIMDISSPRSYDASNRIESSSRVAYDAAGDMTKDGKHRYEYDAERRISQVDGGAADYLYSAEGDRIEKRVGDESTETIWVGDDPIAELKPDGTWVDYLYLDGRRVAAIGKSDATYYVADPLGMTRMELSATGDILAQSDMTPFGQLINRHSDADQVPFTGGEQYDAESGLYSYKYRSYNPQLGRWMSPDPSDEEFARVSNPQSLNLYSYVINDPLKYVDDLGLLSCLSGPPQHFNHQPTQQATVPVTITMTSANTSWGHSTITVGSTSINPAGSGGPMGLVPISAAAAAAATAVEYVTLIPQSVPGSIQAPTSGETPLEHTIIYVTPAQANLMINEITNEKKSAQSYDFLFKNCADFSVRILSAGGVSVSVPPILTPGGLVSRLQQ